MHEVSNVDWRATMIGRVSYALQVEALEKIKIVASDLETAYLIVKVWN